MGIPKKTPSNLSRTPPWPGKKLPLSFTFAFLFKKEKNKSPAWQLIEMVIPNIIFIKLKVPKKTKKIRIKIIAEKRSDPTAPEIVLFGLIFVNLGPLKKLPHIYPPKSENIHVIRNEKVINFNCGNCEK